MLPVTPCDLPAPPIQPFGCTSVGHCCGRHEIRGGTEEPSQRRPGRSKWPQKSWTLNRLRSMWMLGRCARRERGQDAIASRWRNWLACEPLAEATGRFDRPFGDFRGDAQSLAELAVGEGPEGRDEQPGKSGCDGVVDIDV